MPSGQQRDVIAAVYDRRRFVPSAVIHRRYKFQRRVTLGRSSANYFFGCGFLRRGNDGHVCFDNAGLFASDGFKRMA